MIRNWMSISLFLLFLSSILGLWMRYEIYSASLILPFKHILHAHSHTALLGFGFLFILGAYMFTVIPSGVEKRVFYRYAVVYSIAVVGMTLSFLYQSYGAISISFSTIAMILAYIMIARFLREYRNIDEKLKNPLIRWSTYWFLISTLGIWFIGPVTAVLGRGHELYFLSIQFFLHFQFNGWFTYSALGLLIYVSRKGGLKVRISPTGVTLLHISLVLTYFLSVIVVDKHPIFFALNSLGVALQLLAYFLIFTPIVKFQIRQSDPGRWVSWIILTGIFCLTLKVLVQGLVISPILATVSYSVREFIVGYIHLILLGGMTITLGGILLRNRILPDNIFAQIGWIGLIITFIVTETVLFAHAIATWQGVGNASLFVQTIFYTTLPFPVFTGCIVYAAWKNREVGIE